MSLIAIFDEFILMPVAEVFSPDGLHAVVNHCVSKYCRLAFCHLGSSNSDSVVDHASLAKVQDLYRLWGEISNNDKSCRVPIELREDLHPVLTINKLVVLVKGNGVRTEVEVSAFNVGF